MFKRILVGAAALVALLSVLGIGFLLFWSVYSGLELAAGVLLGTKDVTLSQFVLRELAAFIVFSICSSALAMIYAALSKE